MGFRIVDIECYRNWFLLLAMDPQTGQVYRWERFNDLERGRYLAELDEMLDTHSTVTFNGIRYDWWLLSAYLKGFDNYKLFELSKYIIGSNPPPWGVTDTYGLEARRGSHFDLEPVAPLVASLKIYGGRLHVPKLQDLPVHYNAQINAEQRDILYRYCINDLHLTDALRRELTPKIVLRRDLSRQYGTRLVSKSDPQIAEEVIKLLLKREKVDVYRPGLYTGTLKYDPPACIIMRTAIMRKVLQCTCEAEFPLGKNSNLLCPPEIKPIISFRGTDYQMGIGGLHSQEKKQSIRIRPGEYLTDLDVTSYYPFLILTNQLYPEHLGPAFLDVYKSIVDARIEAKRTGNITKAEALKIVVNSSFGKFGSKYSSMHSPKLLLQTTVTGQLYLLMLIEMIHLNTPCKVVSANTDGITVFSANAQQHKQMLKVAQVWEKRTQLGLEPVEYRAVHSVDVNNYFAIKADGSVKGKGTFAPPSLSKNPVFPIVTNAVVDLLKDGVALDETIRGCTDVTQFSTLRKVKGGALYRDDNVGSTIRWYHSTQGSPILYVSNRNRVPNASKARLINQLPSKLPTDIDYDEYIMRADELVAAVGIEPTTEMQC